MDAEVHGDAALDGSTGPVVDGAVDASPDPDPDPDDDDAGASFEVCGTPVDIEDLTEPGHEFIFDVATYAVNAERNPLGAELISSFLGQLTVARFPWLERPEGCSSTLEQGCVDGAAYLSEVYEGSDTAASVLLGISYSLGTDGTEGFATVNNEDLRDLQLRTNQALAGDPVLLAPIVMPNDRIALQLTAMDRWAANGAAAWTTSTSWNPGSGGGYYLDDPVGIQMIERGIGLGVPTFMVWKGRPLSGLSPIHGNPRDVGPVADAYPEARFLILHSVFEHGLASGGTSDPSTPGGSDGLWPEGPYDETDHEADRGRARARQAPALRGRRQYGYPELTPERKAKILGLNAARVFCVQPH